MVTHVKIVTGSKLTKSERAERDKKRNQEKIKQEQEEYKKKMKAMAEKRITKQSMYIKSVTIEKEKSPVLSRQGSKEGEFSSMSKNDSQLIEDTDSQGSD